MPCKILLIQCCKYLNKENEFQSEILKTNENAKILKTENCNAENKNDANKYLENIKIFYLNRIFIIYYCICIYNFGLFSKHFNPSM